MIYCHKTGCSIMANHCARSIRLVYCGVLLFIFFTIPRSKNNEQSIHDSDCSAFTEQEFCTDQKLRCKCLWCVVGYTNSTEWNCKKAPPAFSIPENCVITPKCEISYSAAKEIFYMTSIWTYNVTLYLFTLAAFLTSLNMDFSDGKFAETKLKNFLKITLQMMTIPMLFYTYHYITTLYQKAWIMDNP